MTTFTVAAACSGGDDTSGDDDPAADGGPAAATECTWTAGGPRWVYTVPGPNSVFSIVSPGDVDGDATPDIAVTHDSLFLEPTVGDHLHMLSGAATGEPELLWSASPVTGRSDDEDDPDYGDGCLLTEGCLDTGADLTDDGVPELLFAASGNTDALFAVDGATGATVWGLDTHPDSQAEGGVHGDPNQILRHSDVTGDGVPEVIATMGAETYLGYLIDGASGRVLWRFDRDTSPMRAALSLGDLDGDGSDDVVFATSEGPDGALSEFAVHGVSGRAVDADGDVLYDQPAAPPLWSHETGSTNNWAAQVADIDGDRIGEVAVASWDAKLYLLSGASGDPLWDTGIGDLTELIVNVGDLDGDGIDDLAATDCQDFCGSTTEGIYVISGATGALLWRGVETDDAFGLTALGDLTGDGAGEIATGSGDALVRVYDGASGDLLWSFDTGNERVLVVAALPDVTGDGRADLAAGTQFRQFEESDGGGSLFLLDPCAATRPPE